MRKITIAVSFVGLGWVAWLYFPPLGNTAKRPQTEPLLEPTATAGILATAEARGTPVNDPDLAALLRPSHPIVEEHLTRAQNGHVY